MGDIQPRVVKHTFTHRVDHCGLLVMLGSIPEVAQTGSMHGKISETYISKDCGQKPKKIIEEKLHIYLECCESYVSRLAGRY